MSYKIKVIGTIYGHGKPEDEVLAEIGDMLRYDSGDIEKLDFEPAKYGQKYTAIVHTQNYTKARWDSFLLKTEIIEKTEEKAPEARFNSQEEVAAFIREHRR